MAELQAVWEAQPNQTLPLLIHQLQAAGMSVTSTDDDFRELLRAQLAIRPNSLSATDLSENAYIVETENPTRRILIAHNSVAILPLSGSSAYAARPSTRARRSNPPVARSDPRNASSNLSISALQPTAWQFSSVRACRVSQPLVLLDSDNIPHHLGIVASITVADFPANYADISTGLLPAIRSNDSAGSPWNLEQPTSFKDLANQEWLFRLNDGTLILLGRWLVVFALNRRELSTITHSWVQAKLEGPEPTQDDELGTEAVTLKVTNSGNKDVVSGAVDWAIRVR